MTKHPLFKPKLLSSFGDNITPEQVDELLLTEMEAYEYPFLDYFIHKHDLKYDNNHMIIFTNEFPFTGKMGIKAVLVWGIINALKNHKLFKKYYSSLIKKPLYISEEIKSTSGDEKVELDMAFTNLRVGVKIDNYENLKNETTKINLCGLYILHLDFQKIHKGALPKNGNMNAELLNSRAYSKFLKDLYFVLSSSLLCISEEFRKDFLQHLLKKSIHKKIETIKDNKIKKIKEQKGFDKDSDQYKKLIELIKCDIRNIIEHTNTINFIEKNDSFVKLSNLKDKCVNSEGVVDDNKNNITYSDIVDFLTLRKESEKKKLAGFLYSIFIKKNEPVNNIRVNWKSFSYIIMTYDMENKVPREIFGVYIIESDGNHRKIIDRIREFERFLIPNAMETNEINKCY